MNMPKHIGKYEVISQIASGGFGVIYKGWDPFIKRPVAIKMCATPDEEVRQRFHREAQFVGNLVHRNITLVFDFGVEGDVPFIVQEFLTGYDLDQMLKAGVLGDLRAVASILLQVCEGLEFAHNRGIVHRDIKPSNIRVLEDGTVKIMDFGIAKSVEGGSKLTQTGIALGTAGYLAPEQIQGGAVDPRTDIFALGVLAYELITNSKPFAGSSLSNVLYKILNEHPPDPSQLSEACSPELDTVIRRCIAKSPAARFQSARELADAIRQIPIPGVLDADHALEQTTGALRAVLNSMGQSAAPPEGGAGVTADFNVQGAAREGLATAVPQVPHVAKIEHVPGAMEPEEEGKRSPVLAIFLVLVVLVVASFAVLYFSKAAQDVVFGPAGAPWIPTPTPTATPTPTPTPMPTSTPEPTATPEPSPTPTPAPVQLRMIVDPPAMVTVDGRRYKDQRISSGTISLRPGVHVFVLSYPDFDNVTLQRTVRPDSRTISLTAEIGQITVMPDQTQAPPNGVAYLDGKTLGPIPILRKKVPAGEHLLVVRWDGHEPYRAKVDIPRLPSSPQPFIVAPPR